MNNRNLFVFSPVLYNLYGPNLAEVELPPPPDSCFLVSLQENQFVSLQGNKFVVNCME